MSARTLFPALLANFLGHAPRWYKTTLVTFLILNPLLLLASGPFISGWFLVAEFIFCLAMALKCHPLLPGGLLTLEAVAMGLASPDAVYAETLNNFPVILLLMFMVAGIHFMKELLLFVFTRGLLQLRAKSGIAFAFCSLGALLSAFLDALTVVAVVIAVGQGFYLVYHRAASSLLAHTDAHDAADDEALGSAHRAHLEQFRAFLRDLMMHAAVGTALGGVCTLVGEPQNLLIGKVMGWHFAEFFRQMAPVSLPVLVSGLLTCLVVERFRLFGFGTRLPEAVREILEAYERDRDANRTSREWARILVQAIAAIFLVVALGLHLAEVGLIGLTIVVLQTAFNGITEEHQIGEAFTEALPFTALLVVFFGVVAVIHEQHLFDPIINWGLALEGHHQLIAFYVANGLLSMISDNVFVATVYISQVSQAFEAGGLTRAQFELLAVAINTGTNIPSVATPNGQAAFLFLLTSSLAPLIRLSYGRMVWMALPYTVVMSSVGLFAVSRL